MLERRRVLVGGFLLAAEHQGDAPLGRELDDEVRALVGDPDVVRRVDLHRVGEGPGVEPVADLADEAAVTVELQELRGGGAVGRPQRVAAREHENVPLRVQRHAGALAEIHAVGQLEEVRDRLVGDRRDVVREGQGGGHGEAGEARARRRQETASMPRPKQRRTAAVALIPIPHSSSPWWPANAGARGARTVRRRAAVSRAAFGRDCILTARIGEGQRRLDAGPFARPRQGSTCCPRARTCCPHARHGA